MVRKALQRNGILADKEVESEFFIEVGDLKKAVSYTHLTLPTICSV